MKKKKLEMTANKKKMKKKKTCPLLKKTTF